MIVIEKLIKEIKYQQPLRVDKLNFKQGYIYSILGHNGSGKSTLIKILYKITNLDEGNININNEGFNEEIIHKYIAYNPQKGNFLSGTLKENFEYLYKYSKSKDLLPKQELNKLLEEFKLTHRMDTNIKKLSGGEQAKAQFIRTLVLNKDFNMFDEPMANMDYQTIKQVEEKLIELRSKGKTVILVTHDFMQARRISDYIVFMENLSLIGEYTTKEFFERYEF
ncbi:MAG: ATP-binding cassette domain-containing protein [Peptostreptococcaceae bacterium]